MVLLKFDDALEFSWFEKKWELIVNNVGVVFRDGGAECGLEYDCGAVRVVG